MTNQCFSYKTTLIVVVRQRYICTVIILIIATRLSSVELMGLGLVAEEVNDYESLFIHVARTVSWLSLYKYFGVEPWPINTLNDIQLTRL